MHAVKIAEMLLKLKAVSLNTEQGFLYASGIRAAIYCDNRIILSYPKERKEIVEGFIKSMRKNNLKFDIVAGVATAGIPWAALIASELEKPLVYVRAKAKDHGKENQIEGRLEDGKKVLVVEYLITTGGSALEACKAITRAGCDVVGCVSIFNYSFPATEHRFAELKIPMYSLSDFNMLIQVALVKKYITEDEQKEVLNWHRNPEEWKQ